MRFSRENRMHAAHRTIVVIAECMMGALEAGRFAARNLLNNNSKILLLQTYQHPKFGQSMLRDVSPLLEKIALEELDLLESSLSKEFNISSDSISKAVFNEELSNVLNGELAQLNDFSVLIGLGPKKSNRSFPCRNVVDSVINAGIRPLIVVSDSITLIEKDNIIVYTGDDRQVCTDYKDFLDEVKSKYNMQMSFHTIEDTGKFVPSKETTAYFSSINRTEYSNISQGEVLLRKELKRISVE